MDKGDCQTKKNMSALLTILVIVFLFTGCENGKDASIGKEIPIESIISSVPLPQSDSTIEAELYYDENIILRLNDLEIIVENGTEDSNIDELKDRYSLIDAGHGIIAVVEKVPSTRGECVAFDIFEYNDELIRKVLSSNDLIAQIQNINMESGQVDLYIPNFDIRHTLQFTKDELNCWEQKIVELRDNNVKIDDSYYLDIKNNILMDPIAYHITNSNNNGKTEIIILSDVHTVGAKTPLIRDRAVIIIENNHGTIDMKDIVFERETTEDESLFSYFD